MRVIAGKFKGRQLKMPRGSKLRPTSEKVKEALFNILGEKISDASFLELFAGSGNIGIEAVSRGAQTVILVDNNPRCIKTIETTLRRIGAYAELLAFNAERAVKMLHQKKRKFDFVFLDPPYYEDKLKNCLIKICHYDILKPHSLVIAEHNKRQVSPDLFPKLKLLFAKKYGDTILSFYQKRVEK